MAVVLPIFKQAYRTALTYNGDDVTVEDEVGCLRYELDTTNGGFRVYRFVEVAATAAAAVANGTVLTFSGLYGNDVTDDISESHPNRPAGVGIGAITIGNKGWIQVYGYHSAIKTDGGDDIAAGDTLIVDPSTDGTCDSVAQGTATTHRELGVATTADIDADNTVAGFLTCIF